MRFMQPLALGLIDEGGVLTDFDRDLADIQAQLIRFVREHGPDRAKGAKAKLSLDITLCFDGADATDYSVKATSKKSVPGRPATLSKAVSDALQTGEPSLFVRASGSTTDPPEQRVLTTRDGRRVDPDTGEIVEDPEPEA